MTMANRRANNMAMFLSVVLWLFSVVLLSVATHIWVTTPQKTDEELFYLIVAIGFSIQIFFTMVNESEK